MFVLQILIIFAPVLLKNMKTLVLYLLVIVAFASCSNDKSYVIEGALYGGTSFEGESIYMAPYGATTGQNIDSCVIRDGRFRFEGIANESEMCIIRMRPMMRLFIEQLVFVKEPGHVSVILSKQSSAKGTALNDSLQAWKEYKMKADSVFFTLDKQIKRANADSRDALVHQRDSLKTDLVQHIRSIVNRNDNVFGDYVDRYVK